MNLRIVIIVIIFGGILWFISHQDRSLEGGLFNMDISQLSHQESGAEA